MNRRHERPARSPRMWRRSVLGSVLGTILVGCAAEHTELEVREIASPARPQSGQPNLTAGAHGDVILSWIESAGENHALRYSSWRGDAWSPPSTAAEGTGWFVNWADFPSVTSVGEHALLAHWLQKTGGEADSYGVRVRMSRDEGMHWDEPISPHDASPGEYGFVSTVPLARGRALVLWLDGRKAATGGPTALRSAVYAADGSLERSDLVDPRVCDCCQTSAVRVGEDGAAVVYRDRSESEVRDIAVATFDGTKWSDPRSIHDDGWIISGCPVNGPSVAASGASLAVAWFTAPGQPGAPHVRVAFSGDGGRTFGPPREVDEGHAVGRVDVEWLEDRSAVVTWLEGTAEQARILARHVGHDWARPAVPVATTAGGRAPGFPRMARSGSRLLLAWVEPSSPPRVRTAMIVPAGAR